MLRLILGLALALVAPHLAAAEACGGDAPCLLPDQAEYHIETPEGVDTPPTVFFLHGMGGTSAGIMRNRGLVTALLARGYAVIAPQGESRRPGKKNGVWNVWGDADRRDDVAYLNAVAEDAVDRFGLDRDRMLMAGFSGGGMMAWWVACHAPGDFAAYAPIAGLFWNPAPAECVGPIALLHTHGWADPVVPIEGRTFKPIGRTQSDLFASLATLRRANGCARDNPDEFSETGRYLRRKWTDCAAGAALELAIHPGGHAIPNGWSALALDWFEALPGDDAPGG